MCKIVNLQVDFFRGIAKKKKTGKNIWQHRAFDASPQMR